MRRAISITLTEEEDVRIRNKESRCKAGITAVTRSLLLRWANGEIEEPVTLVKPEAFFVPPVPSPAELKEEAASPDPDEDEATLEEYTALLSEIDLSDMDDDEEPEL